jgi:8-oxo-dGTP pyrophosphatase MutT (NUDIX family)
MSTGSTPLFIAEGVDAPRPDLPFVERETITTTVYDPKTRRYLGLRWKDGSGWETLVTGGIEKGQTAEEAAREEIHQETGYKNLRLVKGLPRYDSKFFHHGKQVNRYAHMQCFLFELVDDARDEVSAEEKKKHECVWLTENELKNFRLPAGMRFVVDSIHQ